MPTPMPDQGRYNGPPPVDLDWLHHDPDQDTSVKLMVIRARSSPTVQYTWRDNHWGLMWVIVPSKDGSSTIVRRLDVQQDLGRDHLTHWGAVTYTAGEDTLSANEFHVATLSLARRKELEKLGERVPVMYPDGDWNCQNWIRALFDLAVAEGLLERAACDNALRAAAGIKSK